MRKLNQAVQPQEVAPELNKIEKTHGVGERNDNVLTVQDAKYSEIALIYNILRLFVQCMKSVTNNRRRKVYIYTLYMDR